MSRTVTLINGATDRASARRVARVNQFDYNSRQLCLVLDKAAQLPEGPGVMLSPLAVPNRYSVTDTSQIFEGNAPSSVFSLRNNTLADDMVNIRHKAAFFTSTFCKKTLRSLRAIGLKFRSQFNMTFSETVDLSAGVSLSVRVSGDINNTQVNTQIASRVIRRRFWGIDNYCQVKDSICENQIGLSHFTVKSSFLVISDSRRDNLSSLESENRDFIQPLPGQDTLVVDHRRMCLEYMAHGPINLIALRDFGYGSYRHLCRKPIILSQIAISHVVQVILTEGLRLESLFRGVVTSLIKSLHSLKESLVLLVSRSEFDYQGLLHSCIVEYFNPRVKWEGGKRQFLPS